MYNINYDIKFNCIVSVDQKCEFCKCTLIIKLHENDKKLHENDKE